MSFENHSEILMCQTEDGITKIDVRMEDETVWLSQADMVILFQSSKANISEHISHIFAEGELVEESAVRKFRTTADDGKQYKMHYSDHGNTSAEVNRIVNMYLEFAELQAKSRKPMYMEDWVNKLDEFMKVTGREILSHAGEISHEIAMTKANEEFNKFSERTKNDLSPVEKHFLDSIDTAEKKLKGKKDSAKGKGIGGDRV